MTFRMCQPIDLNGTRIKFMFTAARFAMYAGRHRAIVPLRSGPFVGTLALILVSAALAPTPRLVSDVVTVPGTDHAAESVRPAAPGVHFASGTVIDVKDGDTVEVSGVEVNVRILGIDSPEKFFRSDCWGDEATEYAEDTLDGQRVDLYTDPTQAIYDSRDRLLAYAVLPDGVNYSVAAARAGAARAYTFDRPVRIAGQISAAQREAQAAGRGLWGAPCFGETRAPDAATRKFR
jgi:micrococcal nuclease